MMSTNWRRSESKMEVSVRTVFRLCVEFEDQMEASHAVTSTSSGDAVIDSGVDSEATTPSSPEEDQAEDEKNEKHRQEDDRHSEMILETAETLLALSGKKPQQQQSNNDGDAEKQIKEFMCRGDTAVVFPQQPDGSSVNPKGSRSKRSTKSVGGQQQQYICPRCPSHFQGLAEVKQHLANVHNASQTELLVLGQDSVTTDGLDEDQRPVRCKVCKKHFANVYRLQRHMISHDESANLRRFKCADCGKAFKFKHHLKEHVRIHTGDKPFECKHCGKRFSHSGSYSSHMTSKKCQTKSSSSSKNNTTEEDAIVSSELSTLSLPQAPLPPSALALSPSSSIHPMSSKQPPRPESNASSTASSSQLSSAAVMSPRPSVALPTEPEPPTSLLFSSAAETTPSHLLAAMAAGAMALTNPLLLNPLLLSTSLLNSTKNFNQDDLLHNMRTLLPQLPPLMAPLLSQVTAQHQQHHFKQPSMAESFAKTYAEEEVANIRQLLESVNASVTKSLLEDNLKKWAANAGVSPQDILKQLAQSQPLPPSQILSSSNGDAAVTTDDEEDVAMDNKKSNRVRALISDDQVNLLKTYYGGNPKPRREELQRISDEIGHPFKVVKVWFQNTRARDRREAVKHNNKTSFPTSLAFNPKLLLPPTPPASCSTDSQKHSSPSASPQLMMQAPVKEDQLEEEEEIDDDEEEEEDKRATPLDLSTKPSTPSASPPPLVINSDADDDDDDDDDDEESDFDDDEEEEDKEASQPAFPMTSRPPIDIEQLAKQHFENMVQAKLVTLEPTAEAMLPDAPVNNGEPNNTGNLAKRSKTEHSSSSTTSTGSSSTAAATATATSTAASTAVVYSCDQCDKTFTKKSSITRHKYEHSDTRPHKCNDCDKAFKHKHHLTEHRRLHSGEKPFQCPKCLKRFSHSGSYSQHINHRFSYCKPYRE